MKDLGIIDGAWLHIALCNRKEVRKQLIFFSIFSSQKKGPGIGMISRNLLLIKRNRNSLEFSVYFLQSTEIKQIEKSAGNVYHTNKMNFPPLYI